MYGTPESSVLFAKVHELVEVWLEERWTSETGLSETATPSSTSST